MKKAGKYIIWKYFYLFLFIALSINGKSQEILDNYLIEAAKNNPGLQVKFNEYMAALEVAPQVKALPDPQIVFGYFIKPVETRFGPQEFKISVSQMFPWFGTLKAKENSAIQMAKAKYEAFEESKSKLFNDVRSTYFNLYFTQKAISITNDNIELLSSFQQLAIIKVEAGKVSAVDEFRIEIELGDLENQLALLKDRLNIQVVLFNKLLNTSNQSIPALPSDLWEGDLQSEKSEILDRIMAQNHQLLSLDFQLESLRFKEKAAKDIGKPDFSVGLDYINIGKGDNNLAGTDAFVFPKLGITIPLYRNKYKAMVQEVIHFETAKQFEKEEKSNFLEIIFENGYKDYQVASRRIDLNRQQKDLAQKSIKILEAEYTTNSKNFEEILRMERKLLKYSLELEKAKADKQAAISFIRYLMGR